MVDARRWVFQYYQQQITNNEPQHPVLHPAFLKENIGRLEWTCLIFVDWRKLWGNMTSGSVWNRNPQAPCRKQLKSRQIQVRPQIKWERRAATDFSWAETILYTHIQVAVRLKFPIMNEWKGGGVGRSASATPQITQTGKQHVLQTHTLSLSVRIHSQNGYFVHTRFDWFSMARLHYS